MEDKLKKTEMSLLTAERNYAGHIKPSDKTYAQDIVDYINQHMGYELFLKDNATQKELPAMNEHQTNKQEIIKALTKWVLRVAEDPKDLPAASRPSQAEIAALPEIASLLLRP